MTLKEILAKHLGNDYPRRNFLYPQLQTDLEKLIEEVAETSYRKGAIDGTTGTITYESPEAFWKSHKERFINHDS